jgi:hypothetical protein
MSRKDVSNTFCSWTIGDVGEAKGLSRRHLERAYVKFVFYFFSTPKRCPNVDVSVIEEGPMRSHNAPSVGE